MKQELKGKAAIEKMLNTKPVFCRVTGEKANLDSMKSFVVRDVRSKNGVMQVKILEGWFSPIEVWTDGN